MGIPVVDIRKGFPNVVVPTLALKDGIKKRGWRRHALAKSETHHFRSLLFLELWQILPHLEPGSEQENICGWKSGLVIQACVGLGEDALSPLLNKQLSPARRREAICLTALTLLPSDLQGFRHLPAS